MDRYEHCKEITKKNTLVEREDPLSVFRTLYIFFTTHKKRPYRPIYVKKCFSSESEINKISSCSE